MFSVKPAILLILLAIITLSSKGQTSAGIGIYPTGTETGVGFRSGKNSKWMLDARIAKANFYSNTALSSFTTEASAICRVISLEKLRFHIGIGARTEWNFGGKKDKWGGVIPVGVEAFPFPFQNAGLIFEIAPFFTQDIDNSYYAGLRTVAGFVFYFPVKEKAKEIKN